ncbi:MAG: hypothetical protein VW645_03255 [Betaproteobacteria bacterium]
MSLSEADRLQIGAHAAMEKQCGARVTRIALGSLVARCLLEIYRAVKFVFSFAPLRTLGVDAANF